MTIDGTFYFTVSSTSCKVHLLVTPEILLEHFKTPTAKKSRLAKSMFKSNVLVVYSVTLIKSQN